MAAAGAQPCGHLPDLVVVLSESSADSWPAVGQGFPARVLQPDSISSVCCQLESLFLMNKDVFFYFSFYLNFLGEVSLVPLLQVPVNLLLPLRRRELTDFVRGGVF